MGLIMWGSLLDTTFEKTREDDHVISGQNQRWDSGHVEDEPLSWVMRRRG